MKTLNKNSEIITSRSLDESSIINFAEGDVPTFKDIMNAQMLLHTSTDDIATELSNRYLKKITGKDFFNTIFSDVDTKYLVIELNDRIHLLQSLLLNSTIDKAF
tara:strand:+ start:306 stop:617 length:312 start_codon:yes stop_codon:yes gene_type:complete